MNDAVSFRMPTDTAHSVDELLKATGLNYSRNQFIEQCVVDVIRQIKSPVPQVPHIIMDFRRRLETAPPALPPEESAKDKAFAKLEAQYKKNLQDMETKMMAKILQMEAKIQTSQTKTKK